VNKKKTKIDAETAAKGLNILITDFIFREIFGKGIITAFKEIYGDKWDKEGIEFNEELEKLLDDFYDEMKGAIE